MQFLKLIKRNCLFSGLSDKEINTLFDCLKGRIVMQSKGTVIAREGDTVTEACILLDGKLIELEMKPDGKLEPLSELTGGAIFGMNRGFLPEKTMDHYVACATDASLLYLDIGSITTMCQKACSCHQKLIYKVMTYLSEGIRDLKENKNYMTVKGMRQKIAKLVYDKYLEQGSLSVTLGMDRNEMASYLNVSRPSMSREMMKMRDEGLFDFWKDKITVKQPERLLELLKK